MNQRRFWLLLVFLGLVWLFCTGAAEAGTLRDRMAQFPQWSSKPAVTAAQGDLVYPDWMAGEWTVTTTLVDLVAPFAPDVVTPGFDSNQDYLHQPVSFQVRFLPESDITTNSGLNATSQTVPQPEVNARGKRDRSQSILSALPWLNSSISESDRASNLFQNPQDSPDHSPDQRTAMGSSPNFSNIVADRAFNGFNLATAYLGKDAVMDVKVDPDSPNRQVTILRGNRQLASTVTGRATETPDSRHFLTTEVFQQSFRGAPQLYFNEVETTTAYAHHLNATHPITADQVTAIYLSPQDADYFKTRSRPVALYRYQLDFSPA